MPHRQRIRNIFIKRLINHFQRKYLYKKAARYELLFCLLFHSALWNELRRGSAYDISFQQSQNMPSYFNDRRLR